MSIADNSGQKRYAVVPDYVSDQPGLSDRAVRVWTKLRRHANHADRERRPGEHTFDGLAGVTYVGQKRIANELGVSRRRIMEAFAELEGAGLIQVLRRRRLDGKWVFGTEGKQVTSLVRLPLGLDVPDYPADDFTAAVAAQVSGAATKAVATKPATITHATTVQSEPEPAPGASGEPTSTAATLPEDFDGNVQTRSHAERLGYGHDDLMAAFHRYMADHPERSRNWGGTFNKWCSALTGPGDSHADDARWFPDDGEHERDDYLPDPAPPDVEDTMFEFPSEPFATPGNHHIEALTPAEVITWPDGEQDARDDAFHLATTVATPFDIGQDAGQFESPF